MIAILQSGEGGGIQSVLGAVMAASLIGLLITPVFSRITKFFPRWSPAWSSPPSA